MALCPECESPLDLDVEDVDDGEVVVCDECGSEFEVVNTDPLELSKVEEGYTDEDDSAFVAEEEEE
jgi:alpha-aminoadipate carrier protein LysW